MEENYALSRVDLVLDWFVRVQPEFAGSTESIKAGTLEDGSTVLVANVQVIDQYRPDDPGVFSLCFNTTPTNPEAKGPCDASMGFFDRNGDIGKVRQAYAASIGDVLSIRLFTYGRTDKAWRGKVDVRRFTPKQPVVHRLNPGEKAVYVGDFIITAVEDPQSKEPVLHIAFKDGFEETKRRIAAEVAAGSISANSALTRMTNRAFTEFSEQPALAIADEEVQLRNGYRVIKVYMPR